MATSWVLGKISDALQPTVQSTVSTAGNFAGGAFNTVGNGINGVGNAIGGTISRYGNGVRDYGNGVMDWSNATGPRAQTASNPLGLNGGTTSGKRAVTSPSVYSAPAKKAQTGSRALTTTTKAPAPVKKATTSPRAGAPVKKVANVPKAASATANRPVGNAAKKTINPASRPAAKAKTGITPAARPKSTSTGTNYVAAANPLGLK